MGESVASGQFRTITKLLLAKILFYVAQALDAKTLFNLASCDRKIFLYVSSNHQKCFNQDFINNFEYYFHPTQAQNFVQFHRFCLIFGTEALTLHSKLARRDDVGHLALTDRTIISCVDKKISFSYDSWTCFFEAFPVAIEVRNELYILVNVILVHECSTGFYYSCKSKRLDEALYLVCKHRQSSIELYFSNLEYFQPQDYLETAPYLTSENYRNFIRKYKHQQFVRKY